MEHRSRGSFSIKKLSLSFGESNGEPYVERFVASFEQRCEGLEPALVGTVDYTGSSDRSAPTTTMTVEGPQGHGQWYTGPVRVTLNATDEDGASDVAAIYYRPWPYDDSARQQYTTPLSFSGDQISCLAYWSADQAGNWDSERTECVSIDGTAPVVSATATLQTGRGNEPTLLSVVGTAHDALAGLALHAFTYTVMDEYGLAQPSGLVTWNDGQYTVRLPLDGPRANDKNGRTYTIMIDVPDYAGNSTTVTETVTVNR